MQRTALALGMQQVVWLGNERPIRWRGQLSGAPAPARTAISGASVYGTETGFQGHIARGSVLGLSFGAECSFSGRWVGAIEIAASRETRQRLTGYFPDAGGAVELIDERRPVSRSVTLAPAVEYHFSPSLGLIAGIECTVAGRNTSRIISPQLALGMFF